MVRRRVALQLRADAHRQGQNGPALFRVAAPSSQGRPRAPWRVRSQPPPPSPARTQRLAHSATVPFFQLLHLLPLERHARLARLSVHHFRAVLLPPRLHHRAILMRNAPPAGTATAAASTPPIRCTPTDGRTRCGSSAPPPSAPPQRVQPSCVCCTLGPHVTQVHLVHHDVPWPQRHPAHHNHGPLCVLQTPNLFRIYLPPHHSSQTPFLHTFSVPLPPRHSASSISP